MRRAFFVICLMLLWVIISAPASAGNLSKGSFERGDLIEVESGWGKGDTQLWWVENNRNDYLTQVRIWQFQTHDISWINLEKRLKAVYKLGTPEWCEKAKEYLK